MKDEHTNAMTPVAGIGQLVQTNRPGQGAALQKIYPIMDMRGTITKWVESDGSTILASQEYDAFGTIIPNSAVGTWPNRFGYQGQAWMDITSADGTQRFLFSPTRPYSPTDGIFIQKDPLTKIALTGNTIAPDFKNVINRNRQTKVRLHSSLGGLLGIVNPTLMQNWSDDPLSIERILRFLGKDPAMTKLPPYTYVNWCPTCQVDPQGLSPEGSSCVVCEGPCNGIRLSGDSVDGPCPDPCSLANPIVAAIYNKVMNTAIRHSCPPGCDCVDRKPDPMTLGTITLNANTSRRIRRKALRTTASS